MGRYGNPSWSNSKIDKEHHWKDAVIGVALSFALDIWRLFANQRTVFYLRECSVAETVWKPYCVFDVYFGRIRAGRGRTRAGRGRTRAGGARTRAGSGRTRR